MAKMKSATGVTRNAKRRYSGVFQNEFGYADPLVVAAVLEIASKLVKPDGQSVEKEIARRARLILLAMIEEPIGSWK